MTARSIAAEVLAGAPAREPITTAIEMAHADQLNAFMEIDESAADIQPVMGQLAGVPIAVKDIIHHAGHTTTCGSKFYRHAATDSATVIKRLEAAGAVIMGRTGLHEFAFGFSSENPWHGAVLNPWNRSTSPGGSSGGSAAAVAAGIVPVALGTDTGGSIRVPAGLCGIYGLKSTPSTRWERSQQTSATSQRPTGCWPATTMLIHGRCPILWLFPDRSRGSVGCESGFPNPGWIARPWSQTSDAPLTTLLRPWRGSAHR